MITGKEIDKTAVIQESPTFVALKALETTITDAVQTMQKLRERLEFVSRNQPTAESKLIPEPKEGTSDLVKVIGKHVSTVRSLATHIQETIDRLEV